jgi:hypothetical protein
MGPGDEQSVDSAVEPPWTPAFLRRNAVMARIKFGPRH